MDIIHNGALYKLSFEFNLNWIEHVVGYGYNVNYGL